MRADAAASVARILDAARGAFADADGDLRLASVARDAGVGAATLYRHFPSRTALARAVYEQVFVAEVEPILLAVARLDPTPDVLLDVAERVVDITRRERALTAAVGNLGEVTVALLERHVPLFEEFMARGRASGDVRAELSGADVPQLLAVFAVGGASLVADPVGRRRYLVMLLDGLRPPADRGRGPGQTR